MLETQKFSKEAIGDSHGLKRAILAHPWRIFVGHDWKQMTCAHARWNSIACVWKPATAVKAASLQSDPNQPWSPFFTVSMALCHEYAKLKAVGWPDKDSWI